MKNSKKINVGVIPHQINPSKKNTIIVAAIFFVFFKFFSSKYLSNALYFTFFQKKIGENISKKLRKYQR
jgi:hypothetical protein